MRLLQPRTTFVTITTYIATTLVLGLWLLAAVAVALYLFFYRRKRPQRAQRLQTTQRSTSFGNTTPRFSPGDPPLRPSYLQRSQTPPYPPRDSSFLSATTRAATFSPVRAPPKADLVPPETPSKSKDSGQNTTVSPSRHPVLAAPPTDQTKNDPAKRERRASKTTKAANLARLQAMALASDTTDMSAETVEPGREVVNAGYMAMLAQKGVPLRDQALLGSDDSTDAGGGTGPVSSYATRMDPSNRGIGRGRHGAPFLGRAGRGRAMTFGQESGDEELERMRPLQVRKMSSM